MRDESGEKVGVKDAHVWHCSLSLLPDEDELSDERWAHICEEFVDGMGFTEGAGGERSPCRWVAVRHGPSAGGSDHVHVVVGLVAEDGTAARVFGDRRTAQRVAGELEQRHGLQVLASRQSGTAARANKPAETEAAVRAQLATVVGQVVADSVSEADFVQRMQTTPGVRIRPRFAAGRQDVVTGYSVAQPTRSGGALRFYGAGSLAPALTLPRLRDGWTDSPQHATDTVTQWQAAKRNQPPPAASRQEAAQPAAMTVPDRLEVTVRACAASAEDEAGFVRALRQADGVRVRPYFARGGTDTVAGYSVALRDSPAADGSPVWYGGGRLARDLTLPRLRADWPTSA